MTLAAARKGFGRQYFEWIEWDLEYCANDFGVSPCTASAAAGSECYNTFKTCLDRDNYLKTIKTYRFCSFDVAGLPVGFEAFPVLKKVSRTPTVLAMGEGLSSRDKLTFDLIDFTHHDRGVDPYISTRTPPQGTFIGRLKARNPYYIGSAVRYYKGYIVDGQIDTANFECLSYTLDQLDPPSKGVSRVICRDVLKLGDEKRAKAPMATGGSLSAGITDVALSLTLNSGEGIKYRLAENLFVHSDDLTDAAWTNGGLVITPAAGNDIHGNAVAFELADDSAAASESISQAASDYSVTEPYTAAIDIEIDAIGRATRFGILRIEHAGSTTETSDLAFDTSTGETDLTTSTGATIKVRNLGLHWRFIITATSNDAGNTSCTAYLLPAAGASATWVAGVAATGSVKASRPQIERNDSDGPYLETAAAAVKNGGVIRVGDELINFTGRAGDVLSWPSTAYRGMYNTTADAHDADDSVQWCLDLTGLNAVRAIELLIIYYTQIPPYVIPFIDWELQRSSKLAGYNITTGLIVKPEGVLNLLADLGANSLANIWVDTRTQTIVLKALAPYIIDTELNESDHFLDRSVKVVELPDERVSQVWVHYGLVDMLNPDRSASYSATIVKTMPGYYKEERIKEIYCRWYSVASPAITLATRMALMLADTPIKATFQLDAKDDIWTGDPIDLISTALQGVDGDPESTEMLVIEANDLGDGRVEYQAKRNPYTGRYGLIAPNGLSPYSSESAANQKKYMFIAQNSGTFLNGDVTKQIT